MSDIKSKYEYGLNDVPPAGHLLINSFQHVLLMFVAVGFPVIFSAQIDGSADFTASLVTFSMLASGIGSIIQSIGLPFIGSGYLCPNVCGPSYMSLSLQAAWIGGIPLMRGLIIIAGIIEMALAPIVQKLRKVFPTFIIGLVVAMVGISIIKMSVSSVFGVSYWGDAILSVDIFIGMFSLLIMVLANLWGKGFIKMYCLLLGIFAGWILAMILVPEYWLQFLAVKNKPIVAFPTIGLVFKSITFDFKLIIPVIVIAISGSLKTFGNLLAAQKISEPDLKEADFVPIRKGLLADGFSTALAGLIGGMAVDTSSSNVGLAGTTKVVSKWVGVVAGIIFIVLAFFPQLIAALTVIPEPILGAALIFAGCFMICTGFMEMFSEGWEPKKTFVVGIALFFGLSTAFLPGIYARAPHFITTFFTDPLPTTTILAVFLNQLFNLDHLWKKEKIK